MVTRSALGVTITPNRAAGFSLVEMLIVLTLLSIVALIALPRVNFTQFEMDAAARAVRMTLQSAQREAITRQFNMVVSFDVAQGKVRVLEDNNDNGSVDNGERVTWLTLEDGAHFATPPAGVNGAASTPVIGSNVQSLSGLPSIIFRRDGASSTDLEVYLTSRRAISADYRGITVVQSTGRTDWFKYIGAAWKSGNL